MEFLFVIVIVGGLAYFYMGRVRAARQWTEVHISPISRRERADRLMAALRSRGVRIQTRQIGAGRILGGSDQMVSIRVHRDDLATARQVMGELGIGAM